MDYLVRHGDTELNESGSFRGWSDVPLNSSGRQQARDAAAWLKDKGIRRVVASDMDRAVETARIICGPLGTKPVIDYGFRPLNVGVFTAQPKRDTWREFERYMRDPSLKIPGGESIDDFRRRNQAAMDRYLRSPIPTVIVVHTSNITDATGSGTPEADDVVPPGGILAVEGGRFYPVKQ